MRYRMAVVLGAILATASCAPGISSSQGKTDRPAAEQYVPGEVLVQFQPGTSARRVDDIVKLVGAEELENLGMPLTYLLRFSRDIAVEEMIQRLRAFGEVRLAEPNRVIRLQPKRR